MLRRASLTYRVNIDERGPYLRAGSEQARKQVFRKLVQIYNNNNVFCNNNNKHVFCWGVGVMRQIAYSLNFRLYK